MVDIVFELVEIWKGIVGLWEIVFVFSVSNDVVCFGGWNVDLLKVLICVIEVLGIGCMNIGVLVVLFLLECFDVMVWMVRLWVLCLKV